MEIIHAHVGDISIGRGLPIVPQTMCNTHTSDVEGTVAQCVRMHDAGAELIRITVPGPADVSYIRKIHSTLRSLGISTPIVADIHFSAATAIAVTPYVEKVRINPGNFHKNHDEACKYFGRLLEVCKDYGTAVRIGVNHGSLGERITSLYGNTPEAMARAAMEWTDLCEEHDFNNFVISLKASNTLVMTEAYRILEGMMKKRGRIYPLHLGVTEAGNGDAGRIKSCVGISALLEEGLGDTLRVSLTEDPVNELPSATYLARRYGSAPFHSSLVSVVYENRKAVARYEAPSRERLLLDFSCDFGKKLLDHDIDDVEIHGHYIDPDGALLDIDDVDSQGRALQHSSSSPVSSLGCYLSDELLQAARRRFYRPEYIACPGCGRTMYDLETTFEAVKSATSHLKGMVIAVMGCVVNGPGEMADADWGYVGEGDHKVSIYRGRTPVLRHIPDDTAVARLLALIDAGRK